MSEIVHERLLNIVRRFSERRLLIVGDSIADKFLYGSISRVSREAPVFILRHELTETVPGGAANCALNLAALGANVSLISVAGNDEAGNALRGKLSAAGVNVEGLVLSEKIQTTTKVRILAGHAHANKQQVIRIDYEDAPLNDPALRQVLTNSLQTSLARADAVIISDYNYGLVDKQAVELIREAHRARNIPVLVDSRFRLSDFSGFTAATPNEDEVEHMVGSPADSLVQLEMAASRLRQELQLDALLVTRGRNGMMLVTDDPLPLQIPAVGAQAVDGTGAGDTVIATFALALASDSSFAEAAQLANYAGGLVVMKRGTASVSAVELEQSIHDLRP
ncbi:MAG TPA: bifunctional ADP-heptose synthase [Pyrinomonadaceae bacterium]|nr:bifunctional ADP-heptose synthase [Pyrinomonadaceae bacterium]